MNVDRFNFTGWPVYILSIWVAYMSESATKEQVIALQAQILAQATVLYALIGELTQENILPMQERQALFAKAEYILSMQEPQDETEKAIYRLAIKFVQDRSVVGSDGQIQRPA